MTSAALILSLTDKLGAETAEGLITYFNDASKDRLANFATKEDIAILKVEIMNVKSDLMKWMFLFWIGQVAVTIGTCLLIFKR